MHVRFHLPRNPSRPTFTRTVEVEQVPPIGANVRDDDDELYEVYNIEWTPWDDEYDVYVILK